MKLFETIPPLSFFLLDFDGVIADSEAVFDRFDGRLINLFLEQCGTVGRLEAHEVRRLAGLPFAEKLRRAAETKGARGPYPLGEFERLRNETRPGLFKDQPVALAPGVEVFLRKHGPRAAIVTNKDREKLEWDMDALDLRDLLPQSVCLTPALRAKPAPDLLIAAMRLIGADPAATAFVGDNELDMRAGAAAGVTPIGFIIEGLAARPQRHEELRDAGAAAVIENFGQLEAMTGGASFSLSGAETRI